MQVAHFRIFYLTNYKQQSVIGVPFQNLFLEEQALLQEQVR